MVEISDIVAEFRRLSPELLNSYCIINGSFLRLDDVERMGNGEFGLRTKFDMPLRLYKYFPNIKKEEKDGNTSTLINYSLQALESNNVYLSSPNQFDDVYDSDINVPWPDYSLARLKTYSEWACCNVENCTKREDYGYAIAQKMYSASAESGGFQSAFPLEARSDSEKISIELFIARLTAAMNNLNNDWHAAIAQTISEEYEAFSRRNQQTFRVSCFATSPFSQLMWGGAYADCHRGFCVEYTIEPNNPKYQDVYYNLFPVIYCKTRGSASERIIRTQDAVFNEETLWDIYFHGALRKSIDWAYQNEWRLLLPGNAKMAGFSVPFYPITKVYLGHRMLRNKRAEVIDICHSKGIPYIGVKRSSDIFEMQECDILCENCAKYNNTTETG